jgi:hypothetical protein
MPNAVIVLAMAKSRLMPAAVRMNISGSMIGDDTQKAITGARGTPAASMPAITGITPHEQNGDSAPANEAAMIATVVLPAKARAINWSAPLALA